MNKKTDYLLFAIFFVVLLITLPGEVGLKYEWLLIMEESDFSSGLKMYGMPSAYMPPLYPYYLLLCKGVFGFTDWLKVSLVLQGLLYFFSLRFLVKTLCSIHFRTLRVQIFLLVLLLFPPLFAGNITVSSLSMSVSLLSVFFALLYRISNEKEWRFQQIAGLAAVSVLGLYLRYEFLYIILIAGAVFLYLRKIKIINFILTGLFVFISYLPWMVRNYLKIGKFTYSTSLNYNFAKGYNLKYNVFSAYNFPYSPKTDEVLPVEVLYSRFDNEREIDSFLSGLNSEFVATEHMLFVKLTLQKFAVNFTQYFPDYGWMSGMRIYIFYSIFFLAFQFFLVWALLKIKNRQQGYLFVFTLSIYLFVLIFYTVAPMPRYFLLFVPYFSAVIARIFLIRNA